MSLFKFELPPEEMSSVVFFSSCLHYLEIIPASISGPVNSFKIRAWHSSWSRHNAIRINEVIKRF